MLDKLEKMHPMRMVFYASITQVAVLALMLIGMKLIYIFT